MSCFCFNFLRQRGFISILQVQLYIINVGPIHFHFFFDHLENQGVVEKHLYIVSVTVVSLICSVSFFEVVDNLLN